MAIQTINIGNIVNDGLGDDLRTAFQKVNANFAELNSSLTVTASNLLGENRDGNVFKQKVGNNLEFKTLVAGNNVSFTPSVDSIRIDAAVPSAFTQITTSSGVVRATEGQGITLQGGDDLLVTSNGPVITINSNFALNNIFRSLDFGPIGNANPSAFDFDFYSENFYDQMMQLVIASSNLDFGTFSNPGRINIDMGLFSGT